MSSAEQNGQHALKSLEGIDPDDLLTILKEQIKDHPELAEEVNARIDQIRHSSGKNANNALKFEETLSAEQSELLEKLEAQYPAMKAALELFNISINGMPSWGLLNNGLTTEVLDKALKLAEPELLLVPPTSLESKFNAVNDRLLGQGNYQNLVHDFNDNELWNGGKSKPEKKWKTFIVEGIENVEQDEKIYNSKRTAYQIIKLWVRKLKKQGLGAINDADTYLTLVMKALSAGKLIDAKSCTVLNGLRLRKTLFGTNHASGFFELAFYILYSGGNPKSLRLRGLVEVILPETDCL